MQAGLPTPDGVMRSSLFRKNVSQPKSRGAPSGFRYYEDRAKNVIANISDGYEIIIFPFTIFDKKQFAAYDNSIIFSYRFVPCPLGRKMGN